MINIKLPIMLVAPIDALVQRTWIKIGLKGLGTVAVAGSGLLDLP